MVDWENKEPTHVETKEPVKEAPKETEGKEPEKVASEVKVNEAEKPEKIEDPRVDETVKVEPKIEGSVPQSVVGKALKAQREKFKEKQGNTEQKILELEAKIKSFQEKLGEPEPFIPEEDRKIAEKVQNEFLRREDAYGRETYGQEYIDAYQLLAELKNPVLTQKILSAARPADTLIKEMRRIGEELEYGSDPEERAKKLEQEIETRVRKKVEAEFAEKLKARGNQPTDVQNVRAAGGDVKSPKIRDSWSSGRGSLPK